VCALAVLLAGCDPSPEAVPELAGGASALSPEDSFSFHTAGEVASHVTISGEDEVAKFVFRFLDNNPAFGSPEAALLLASLRDLDPAYAALAIKAFLQTGQERATGERFALTAEGVMHSGLRALLLDELGRIDLSGAAAVSRKILDNEDPPGDLRAIALRHLAAAAPDPLPPEESAYLRAAWEKLASSPGVADGSCEASMAALGMASFLRDQSLLAPLFALRETASTPAAAESIEQTAERLVLAAPTDAVSELASNPEAFARVPGLRARLIAHADVSHPQEEAAVRAFLTDPRTSEEEVRTFLLHYPNEEESLRPELFEQGNLPLLGETAKMHIAALENLRRWQRDPAMQSVAEAISVMQLKLEAAVGGKPEPGAR
jgi:hypothetical protein